MHLNYGRRGKDSEASRCSNTAAHDRAVTEPQLSKSTLALHGAGGEERKGVGRGTQTRPTSCAACRSPDPARSASRLHESKQITERSGHISVTFVHVTSLPSVATSSTLWSLPTCTPRLLLTSRIDREVKLFRHLLTSANFMFMKQKYLHKRPDNSEVHFQCIILLYHLVG